MYFLIDSQQDLEFRSRNTDLLCAN